MSRTIFVVMIIGLLLSVQTKPVFVDDQNTSIKPSDLKNLIAAFFDGYDINQYANATVDCRNEGGVLYDFVAAGVEDYLHNEYYQGSLEISDALGEMSPLSRVCYDTTEELSDSFNHYRNQFAGFKDFISKISINLMSNIKPIKSKATLILTEYLTTKNYTNVAFLAGEITSLTFVLDEEDNLGPMRYSPLKYTEADPMGPNPINDIMWIAFEGLYKFVVNSRMASKDVTQTCQNSALNMILLDEKAISLWRQGDNKNAWFAFTDSLTFAHQVVDGCYHMGKEIGVTFENIKQHGQIGKNLLHNLFFVVSGLFGTWSQVYYHDWLNLIGVLGDVAFRVFVDGSS